MIETQRCLQFRSLVFVVDCERNFNESKDFRSAQRNCVRNHFTFTTTTTRTNASPTTHRQPKTHPHAQRYRTVAQPNELALEKLRHPMISLSTLAIHFAGRSAHETVWGKLGSRVVRYVSSFVRSPLARGGDCERRLESALSDVTLVGELC